MESHHTDHLMTWEDSIPSQQQFYEVDMKSQLTQLKSSSKNTDLSRQSSSSSSLGSLSGGSSEYSDFLFTIANSSCLPDHVFNGVIPNQAIQSIPSLPVQFPATTTPVSPFDRSGNTQFRSSYTNDDAAMMRAMLAVLSSSPSSSSSSSTPPPSTSGRAFQPYRSMGNKKIRPLITNCRPNMSKVLLSILRGINNKRMAESVIQETPAPPQPTTNQLHHMISERKRREKLNDSFQALRTQLPRGTRKDKASVLAATKEYMTYLKGQISELEEKNRALEMNLFESDDENDDKFGISGERVRFHIKKTSEDTLGLKQIDVRIRVRVESDDIIDLILQILDSMKEMGNIDLVSLNHLSKRAGLVIQIKTMDVAWNEVEFRKKITKAVDVSKGTLRSTQGQEPNDQQMKDGKGFHDDGKTKDNQVNKLR